MLIFDFIKDILFIAGYLSRSNAFPKPLSAAEEKETISKLLSGDDAARDRLIEHNLRLVAHIVKKYGTSGVDSDDLISIGTIGLIKGINTFSPDRGKSLAAYCSRCIENEILMYLRSLKKTVSDISLSEPIGEDADGNKISLADILDSGEKDVEEIAALRLDTAKLKKIISGTLTKRELAVIELRYGLNGKKPQPQRIIAERLGISRSYISRIEKKALEKLAAAMEKDNMQ